jgi:calcineurin-like phosphoesterase family protein
MKFRDDIDPANTWVVSDTHFGHENIVGFCFRPEDHEQVMIAQWRKVVPDDATVIHLGDICYGHNGGNTRFRRLTSKELTGKRKLLIKGNHDNQSYSFYRDCGFKLSRPFKLALDYSGRVVDPMIAGPRAGIGHIVSFAHYPWSVEEDGEQQSWDWRVHGHIHNNGYTRDGFVPFLRNHINISVEQTRYTPVNLKLLLDACAAGQVPAVDARADRRRSGASREGDGEGEGGMKMEVIEERKITLPRSGCDLNDTMKFAEFVQRATEDGYKLASVIEVKDSDYRGDEWVAGVTLTFKRG